jgi:acetyl-CoA carboxylase carboxyl transferase subunit alpha
MISFLDFEKPIAELEGKIHELRQLGGQDGSEGLDIEEEISTLQDKADRLLRETYANLEPWQKVQVARHPNRPQFQNYVGALIEDFVPMAGDRGFAEDYAIQAGLGRFNGRPIMVIGHEKGTDTQSRIKHNFGSARPEGYRKATRLMRLADKFGLAVITLIDTQGAYPGVGAEERGQAEAIARCTEACLEIKVPLISCIIGEGGSGGAVALAVGNRVLMLEHAVYSVISPEGCASILWRSAEQAQQAAEALKLTANDLAELKVIDAIVEEPVGGAHRAPGEIFVAVKKALETALAECDEVGKNALRQHRRDKFLEIGRIGIS